MDLPAEAKVNFKRGSAGGFDIWTIAETYEQFAARLREIEAELLEQHDRDGQRSLESTKDWLIGDRYGKILVITADVHKSRKTII